MSVVGLETLDHSFHLAHEWINEIDDELGWNDRHRSYRLLRAVLQTLRECLPLAEAAHLSAQLPLVFRGVFFEGWHPAGERHRHWNLDDFFARISEYFSRDPIEDVGDAVSGVFGVLEKRISGGEIEDVLACLPAEIRALWPAEAD